MIVVKQGLNEVLATLSERVTLPAPYFLLLRVTNVSDELFEKIVLVNNLTTSEAIDRIGLELVADKLLEDLSGAKIHLNEGEYRYEFYESLDTSLDVSGKTLLEVGLLRYYGLKTETLYNEQITEKTYRG